MRLAAASTAMKPRSRSRPRRHDLDGEAGDEARRDERHRSPQPDRTIGAAAHGQALERIGLRERHDRRVEHGRQRISKEDRECAGRQADQHESDRADAGADHDRLTQGVAAVGFARGERNAEHADQRWHGDHQSDQRRIDALGLEPDREKRELDAREYEKRDVEGCQPRRET
jgi:hypothetical protein